MARQYLRNSRGMFASTSKAKNTAERRRNKRVLSGSALGGKGKGTRAKVAVKPRGGKASTRQARKFASKTARRFR